MKTNSLDVFRNILGIPTKFSNYFTFAENSRFSKKIPHDKEQNFLIFEALANYYDVVNKRKDNTGAIKEKAFKLTLFTEPY